MTHDIVFAVAKAFLAGVFEPQGMAARAASALGHPWRWLPPLARRVESYFRGSTRPRLNDLVQILLLDSGFETARQRHDARLHVATWITEPPMMQPASAASGWDVPQLETITELAAWLEITPSELEWFADLKHYLRRPRIAGQLRHYRYRILKKSSGNLRLIEAPKPRLKAIQRKILAGILNAIPPHDATHGFRKGRSIRSFTAPHSNRKVVVKMDLQDFFPSIHRARVQALFRTAGYPEAVAGLLGGLCTTVSPREIWRTARECDRHQLPDSRSLYATPHLPQGAPTSPAIANLCAFRVDCRLLALAKSAGATYTRYADDLAFSGGHDFARSASRFSLHAASILIEEGFEVHHRKTRIMRQGVRQQLAGLVVNHQPNIRRADYDTLKAILTNCVRNSPTAENRDAHPDFRAHLDGRVAFVESIHPIHGAKLRAIFNRIDWTAG